MCLYQNSSPNLNHFHNPRKYKHTVDNAFLLGTGTPVGDPIEVNALGRMIRSYIHDTNSDKIDELNETQNDRKSHSIKHINQGQTEMNGSDTTYSGSKILIGSVKTNIGHLEAAAGVAGIIKVLLMMHHGMFVPSLHAKIDKSNWNKTIKFGEYGLDISVKVQPWNKNENGERLGCVNSFGFGGSNSHCIVIQRNSHQDMATENREHQIKLICVTAIDRLSLLYALEKLDNDLEKTNHTLQDVSFSSLFHRNHYRCRVLLFGKNKAEIRSQISKQIVCLENPEAIRNNNIVFVFCGMGTAWTGMCQDLMKEQSTFRETIQDIDNIMEEFTGFRMEDKFQNDTVYNDPFLDALAIFYVQIGLYHVWKSWGILPNAVIGQSVGEVAAAYASGALTLRDATKVIYVRSKYVSCQAGGKMMVVGNFSEDLLRDLCKRYENKVDIAGFQSPTSFTLSGDADVMEKIKSDLVEISRNYNENVLIRPLAVNCAYHSHHMDQCLDDIEAELKGLSGGKMVCRHLSTVSGMQVEGNVFINGQYWKENVRLPVKFRHNQRINHYIY
jgi:acyl transferase domain-containing protein